MELLNTRGEIAHIARVDGSPTKIVLNKEGEAIVGTSAGKIVELKLE